MLSQLSTRPSRALASLLTLAAPAALLLGTSPVAFAKPEPLPDWVHTAASAPLPKLPSDTNAVVLLDDTTLHVTPDGHASEHHRRIVRILRPSGRDDARVFLPFSTEELLSNLHVWSIGPDGHEYTLKDKEIGEIGYPGGGNFYVDIRARIATAPGSDPGGIVAVEYDQALPPYLNESIWDFQTHIPTLSTSYLVDLPPGFTVSTTFAHHTSIPPSDLEHGRSLWSLTNVPAIDLHNIVFTPNAAALAGRMSIHFNGPGTPSVGDTWPGIGAWYTQLSSSRLTATPEISSKAHELAGSSTDFVDRTEPIAEWVQREIRYFVIERGIGGLQPHPAADIFRNHFGDCKDKATLLASMLGAVGVHVDLLMVDSRRGAIDPTAPSLFGNHMIAAIELPAGYTSPRLQSVATLSNGKRVLIFDPTWDQTPFGEIEHNLQGSYGVLVDGSSSQILRIPVLPPEDNRIRRSATFHLAADGSLTGTVTERRFGDSAEDSRRSLLGETDKERSLRLDRTLGNDLPQFTVSGLTVENAAALNKDLTTSFSLTADHFGKSAGPLLILRPRVLGTENILRLLDDHRDTGDAARQQLPFDLHATLEQHDDFTIDLPAGYTAEELPDAVTLDLGFASYRSSTTLEGHTLHFNRTYTVREVTLPADRSADLHKLASTIATDEQSTAVLKKP